jgi:pimeloyl-ACP methyl ester carboxylesterase
MAHLELVQVRTADGVRLDGALATPKGIELHPGSPVDATILVHGTGSNFYTSSIGEGLAPKLLADGLAVLRVNTRGHDVISNAATLQGARRFGSSLEHVEDCCHDLLAWTELLVERGFRSVAVIGHSLGGIKTVYAAVHAPHPAVKRMIVVSPPRLAHGYYLASEQKDTFQSHYREAQQYVAAGKPDELMNVRFPLPFLVSAASFLEKYGPDEKYNFLRYLKQIATPALFTFGTVELEEVNFRGLPEAIAEATDGRQNIRVVTVEGANHSYTGKIDELSHNIRSWLAACR